MDEEYRNVLIGLFLIIILLFTSSAIFSTIEEITYRASFFYIFSMITTIGAVGIGPTTLFSEIFIMLVVVSGMGTALYVFTQIAKLIITIDIKHMFMGDRNMKNMTGHVIVCGYGRIGKYVCDSFEKNNTEYVVVDKDQDKITSLQSKNIPSIRGSALDPETLKSAKVENAKALVATMDSDANNVFCIMSAKELNGDLILGAEATNDESVDRLHKIGANVVVYPAVIGGEQLAHAVINKETENKETISKTESSEK